MRLSLILGMFLRGMGGRVWGGEVCGGLGWEMRMDGLGQGKGQQAGLTMCSIQTWALEEARRRLEAEGILADPDVKKD